jgi:tetratricopeptide (TPR) repeat protein
LGAVKGGQGELEGALGLLEEALELNRGLGDDYGVAVSLNNLGIVVWERGECGEAEAYFEKSLGLVGDLNLLGESLRRKLVVSVLDNLARVRFGSNGLVDDLFGSVPGDGFLEEIGVLKGWKSMRDGHSTASRGRWEEAWELVERGERMVEGLGVLRPSRYAWRGVRLVGDRAG